MQKVSFIEEKIEVNLCTKFRRNKYKKNVQLQGANKLQILKKRIRIKGEWNLNFFVNIFICFNINICLLCNEYVILFLPTK